MRRKEANAAQLQKLKPSKKKEAMKKKKTTKIAKIF